MKWGTRGATGGLLLLAVFACGKFGGDDPGAATDAGPSDDGPGDAGADARTDGGARLYVFGGGSSPDAGSLVVYSAPVLGAGLGDFQAEPAPLGSARIFASSTSIDGTLVSLGGVHPDGTQSDELETLPQGDAAWSKRSIGFFGAFYAVAAGNHRVFVFGGRTSDNAYDARLHVGDFTSNPPVWSTVPSAGAGRARAAAAFLGDTLYVAGGIQLPGTDAGGDPMAEVSTGRFSGSSLDGGALGPALPLRKGRQDHRLVALAQHVYALGGYDSNNNALTSVEVASLGADGSLGPWSVGADMPEALGDFCAAATADAVFVVGGFTHHDGVGPVADAWVGRYVGGDLSWSSTTSLPAPLGGLGCAIR